MEGKFIFIQNQINNGNLPCRSFIVHDLIARRDNLTERYLSDPINARYCSAFQYYVIGRASSHYKNWKQKKKDFPKSESTSSQQNYEEVKENNPEY